MKIAIIADDLTGANDTGVQFSEKGFSTTVLLELKDNHMSNQDVVVFDTDSRSVSREEAYQRVKEVCEYIKVQKQPEIIYKKIDSTMRGNIGAEWDAIYDAFQPDFIVIAPSYPKIGRVVKNGSMFVDGVLLHETDTSRDPKNPLTSSYLPAMLNEQTDRSVFFITTELLRGNQELLEKSVKQLEQAGIPYLVFEAETEADLKLIVSFFQHQEYRVIWSGSAGLANALSIQSTASGRSKLRPSNSSSELILIVVGSVNSASRRQLNYVLQQDDVAGVEMSSEVVLTEAGRQQEMDRVFQLALKLLRDEQKHVVLYSSGSPESVIRAQDIGKELGMNANQVSNTISDVLGIVASQIIKECQISSLVLTGGDTAKQVCLHLGATEIELIAEIEAGVPIGWLSICNGIYVVTKAGGFGSDEVLHRGLHALRGGDKLWNRSLG